MPAWVKQISVQPLITWLTRQRPEVVLLFFILIVGVVFMVHTVPSALDRHERFTLQREQQHTEQIRIVSEKFSEDQRRDSEVLKQLIGRDRRVDHAGPLVARP